MSNTMVALFSQSSFIGFILAKRVPFATFLATKAYKSVSYGTDFYFGRSCRVLFLFFFLSSPRNHVAFREAQYTDVKCLLEIKPAQSAFLQTSIYMIYLLSGMHFQLIKVLYVASRCSVHREHINWLAKLNEKAKSSRVRDKVDQCERQSRLTSQLPLISPFPSS